MVVLEEKVTELLARARATERTQTLTEARSAGAEGYFQSFAYVAGGNPDMDPSEIRENAMDYLILTASGIEPGNEEEYAEGAREGYELCGELLARPDPIR